VVCTVFSRTAGHQPEGRYNWLYRAKSNGKPGEKIDPGALKVFLKSRISAFKVPKEFRVVSELPKSPAGKILKRRLRKEVKEN
jgi:acyl-CoA synthetase (AMP-forming)/AMP-acid ligase II